MNFKQPKPIKEIKAPKKGIRLKYVFLTATSIWLLVGTMSTVTIVLNFINEHDFRTPIIIQSPIVKKQIISPVASESASLHIPQAYAEEIEEKPVKKVIETGDDFIASYIKSKDWDYSIAIRVAKSENFWNLTKSFDCGRKGAVNNDGTHDIGIFQINTIHTAEVERTYGMDFEEAMSDCKRNIDFAYKLYERRGNFSAWVAYNNGKYLNHSEL